MTEKSKGVLSKIGAVLSIAVVLITFIVTMVRNYDLTYQVAETVDKVNLRLESERKERTKMDTILQQSIASEREERKADIQAEKDARKDEYTKIQVRLTEIDTTLVYIKQGIDRLEGK